MECQEREREREREGIGREVEFVEEVGEEYDDADSVLQEEIMRNR